MQAIGALKEKQEAHFQEWLGKGDNRDIWQRNLPDEGARPNIQSWNHKRRYRSSICQTVLFCWNLGILGLSALTPIAVIGPYDATHGRQDENAAAQAGVKTSMKSTRSAAPAP